MTAKTTNYTKFYGLQGFLNLLLFGTYIPPDLIEDKYYLISKKIVEKFSNQDKIYTSNNEIGMHILEETLIEITVVKECRRLRRELVKCYHNSLVDYRIDYMIMQQKKSYSNNALHFPATSPELMKIYSSLPYIPINLKAYISNHFVDLFENFNPYDDKISKRKYEFLLKKYLKNNTYYKIHLNIEKHEKIKPRTHE